MSRTVHRQIQQPRGNGASSDAMKLLPGDYTGVKLGSKNFVYKVPFRPAAKPPAGLAIAGNLNHSHYFACCALEKLVSYTNFQQRRNIKDFCGPGPSFSGFFAFSLLRLHR
jgi:hypothetical protein